MSSESRCRPQAQFRETFTGEDYFDPKGRWHVSGALMNQTDSVLSLLLVWRASTAQTVGYLFLKSQQEVLKSENTPQINSDLSTRCGAES